MKHCTECGSKLPQPNPKHCPECGAALAGTKAAAQPAQQAGAAAAAAKGPNTLLTILGITLGLALGAILISAIVNSPGGDYGYATPSPGTDHNTITCPVKIGETTCGYCAQTDKCYYCKNGYACSGDICALTCQKQSPSASATAQPQNSATPTAGIVTGQPGDGIVIIDDPPIDSRTNCPPQGYSGPRGSVSLECSQWVTAGTCSIQSCSCYYSDHTGDTVRAYYHTSNGAYYPCSGSSSTLSCTASVQALAADCGGSPPWSG
ncbi:Uncharacterised protein [Candidatus Norongarragalina meridionalis]|nr:Uncharacterised protein [Candidatus Norongarragalina meridionalis]